MATNNLRRVVVIGGGFGGLETAFTIKKHAGDRVDLTLIADQTHFLFKPNTIYIPFGADPGSLRFPLSEPVRRKQIRFVQARATYIDPERKVVDAGSAQYPYDYLVVATGASMRPEEIPGLQTYAKTIFTPDAMLELRDAFQKLLLPPASSKQHRVLFLVPPNNKCSGPLYELIMMLDSWLRRSHARDTVSLTWATYEHSFIQAFGPRVDTTVRAEFLRRGITGYTEFIAQEVSEDAVIFRNGQRIPFDLLVSFPPYIAATPFSGLPSDDRGFLTTDSLTRQVVGFPEIYAVGDAGDFPVKQAFLALLQGDVAGQRISDLILSRRPTATFEPTSMCVMEQFDRATFANVPLKVTGIPDRPVEVRSDAANLYRVGTSPAWRLGKKMLGIYLPWRFRAGEPFHEGLPWQGMELGLKVMATALAH